MRFFAVVAALVSAAAAATIDVIVGEGGNLTYTPPAVAAAVGDIVRFTFVTKNHTVTQSTFATPCAAMAGGVTSGFQGPGTNTNATTFTQWSFTVNVATPLWFYCQQTGHCQKGMVFAVNPTADKSFAAYQANAMGTSTNTSQPGAQTTAPSSALSLTFNSAAMLGALGVVAGLVL